MYKNEMQLKIPSLSQNESFARVVVGAFAAQLNPTLEELVDIKTAVSEAVTNAIIHGYEKTNGYVDIHANLNEDVLELTIRDYGQGINDVSKALQPFYTSKPDADRSGMGFTVMETFMDELKVDSRPGEGTTIYMKKRIISAEITNA
ncbi:anti-sigma F factor [Clostridia bacterium OttesenSCG-928-F22]|nr:anti-sigma F factor [Clostridia bacterium OttesenSCG-928-F22]